METWTRLQAGPCAFVSELVQKYTVYLKECPKVLESSQSTGVVMDNTLHFRLVSLDLDKSSAIFAHLCTGSVCPGKFLISLIYWSEILTFKSNKQKNAYRT